MCANWALMQHVIFKVISNWSESTKKQKLEILKVPKNCT